MRRRLVRWGPALGLLGVGIVAVAALVTALAYSGIEGEPYGPLNHTVSELGERGVSELAALFNLGLLVGGVLVIGFMLSIALGSDSQAGRVFGVLGMLTGFAVILVGLFPVDDFDAHKVAAILTFGGIALLAAWFAGWVFAGDAPYPRVLGALAVWLVFAMVAFLALPNLLQPEHTFAVEFDPTPPPRPVVWVAALLEWVVISSALVWIALLAWHERSRTIKATRETRA